MHTLIADSGGTKTDWLLTDGATSRSFRTEGLNPFAKSSEEIADVLQTQVLPHVALPTAVTTLAFYGAGCTPAKSAELRALFSSLFPSAAVEVHSDLQGAARALCGHSEGIVAILGTGANSGLYDGERIVMNTPPLGYILGDEGSGAVLGRRLLSDVFKAQLPAPLLEAFHADYGLDVPTLLQRVYRTPAANRYLASFAPFLARHRAHEAIRALLLDEFRRFLLRNVAPYRRPDLPLSFVGGIAHAFQEELTLAVRQQEMQLGQILAAPIEALAAYHR